MAYDNIKSHKKQGFIVSLEDTFFGKQQGEIKLSPPVVLGLKKDPIFILI